MPTRTITTKFFEFDQNNSGGNFVIDDERGLGPSVWIEAADADSANAKAENIGIYFDGCQYGRDCDCCGDRWHRAWREGADELPTTNTARGWHDTVYVHMLDGTIKRNK